MKRFKFKLQSLLNYKKHLEQVARQEMAKVVADVNQCEQQIKDLHEDKALSARKLDRLVEKGISAQEFNLYNGFLTTLDNMILDEKNRKISLKKLLAEKRSMLKKRTIDKKAMERLRERRAEEFTREMLLEEQKGLDEIGTLKTVREMNNGQR
ncbi:MAG: flagellar export protein FliJ [Desulfobacter sp.]